VGDKMSGLFQVMVVIFIIVGIFQNKEENYWKKISFTITVLSIFSVLYFLPALSYIGGHISFAFIEIQVSNASIMYTTSLVIGILSFIVFLFSDTK